MNEVCCHICAGPFEIDVPMPGEGEPGPDGKKTARDWSGFASAIIAILQALANILGPIIGPQGQKPEGTGTTPAQPTPGTPRPR